MTLLGTLVFVAAILIVLTGIGLYEAGRQAREASCNWPKEDGE